MSNSKNPKNEVGYGKPPKNSRFKKGKSGNPRGRPKGQKNFNTYLTDMLHSKIPIMENGKPRNITTMEAGLARLREKALKGDIRALEKLLGLAEHYGAIEAEKDAHNKLSNDDQAIYEAFEAKLRLEGSGEIKLDGEEGDE